MLLALRVRKVAALIAVKGQAQFTLISAKMVAHEVRILHRISVTAHRETPQS